MPQLVSIIEVIRRAGGTYHAFVEIDFSDTGGGIERCHYGVSGFDPAPLNQQILAAIYAGKAEVTDPPEKEPPVYANAGAPDVSD